MAVVRSLEATDERAALHPTEVDCELRSFVSKGKSYLQISSFGSDDRRREKKVSQTLQFDRESALQLAAHIERVFGS